MVDLDKNNRSVSLLRYLVIFPAINLQEIFNTPDSIDSIRAIIYDYFKKTHKEEDAKLISTYVFPSYVEINFQSLPTLNLVSFISNLKSVTARYFLKAYPHIKKSFGGCWNKSYFLATREQMVPQHVRNFLEQQYALRAVNRMIQN